MSMHIIWHSETQKVELHPLNFDVSPKTDNLVVFIQRGYFMSQKTLFWHFIYLDTRGSKWRSGSMSAW